MSSIEILANFLVAKYPSELAAGDVKGLVEDAVNNYSYTEWSPYNDALRSSGSYLHYAGDGSMVFSILYAFFFTQFNIDLLKYNFKFSCPVEIHSAHIEGFLASANKHLMKIDSNPSYKLNIVFSSNALDLHVEFNNSFTELPQNIRLSCRSDNKGTSKMHVYLPDSLNGKVAFIKYVDIHHIKAAYPIFYFTPVSIDGSLCSKFTLSNIDKIAFKGCFKVKQVTESYTPNNSHIKKYSTEWYKQKSEECRNLFYEYSGLSVDKNITLKDIQEHRFGAFNRISRELGFSEQLLEEVLLEI